MDNSDRRYFLVVIALVVLVALFRNVWDLDSQATFVAGLALGLLFAPYVLRLTGNRAPSNKAQSPGPQIWTPGGTDDSEK